MRRNRTWLSLLSYCVLTGLAVALAFALVIAGGSVALASHQGIGEESKAVSPATAAPQSGSNFTGMISDSHCGARHMRKSNMTAAQCAEACYRKGASYVLIDGNHRYTLIGGENALGKLVGERAKVTGNLQDDTIIVDSAAPLM